MEKIIARVSLANDSMVSVAVDASTNIKELQVKVLEKLLTKETIIKPPDNPDTCVIFWKKNDQEIVLQETSLVLDVMKKWKKKDKNVLEIKLSDGCIAPSQIENWNTNTSNTTTLHTTTPTTNSQPSDNVKAKVKAPRKSHWPALEALRILSIAEKTRKNSDSEGESETVPYIPTDSHKRSLSGSGGEEERKRDVVQIDGMDLELPQGIITKECTLFVKVIEARKLPIMDITGSSDPYCVVALENSKLRTRTIWKNHMDPFWGEDYTFTVSYPATAELLVTVYDEDKHSRDDVIGKVAVPVPELKDQQPHEMWYPLAPVYGRNMISGELLAEVLFEPPSNNKRGTLRVTVMQARNLTVTKDISSLIDAFCCVHWNDEEQKTGIVKRTRNPLWNEEFEFNKVTENSGHVKVVLWDGAKEKNVFIGQTTIFVSTVGAGMTRQMCLELTNEQDRSDKIEKKVLGEIRLRVKYVEDQVLPAEAYNDLLGILMDKDLALVSVVGSITEEKEELAWTLNKIFFAKHKSLFLLKTLTTKEITETGFPYLRSTLHDIIKYIYSCKKSAEVDPNKMEKHDDMKKNFSYLHSNVEMIVKKIFQSVDSCPLTLRELFRHLQDQVLQQFGTGEDMENMKKFIDNVSNPPPTLANPPAIEVPAIFMEKELERAHQHLRKHRIEITNALRETNKIELSVRLGNILMKLEATRKALIQKWSL